MRDFRLSRKSA